MGLKIRRQHLKNGVIDGEHLPNFKALMAASEVIKAKGANFIERDSSGHFTIADASTTLLYGILIDHSDETTLSTAGETVKNAVPASACPKVLMDVITGTATQAMVGKTCDLAVSSNKVGADVTASTTDVLLIIEVNLDTGQIVAIPNPAKLTGYTGVV